MWEYYNIYSWLSVHDCCSELSPTENTLKLVLSRYDTVFQSLVMLALFTIALLVSQIWAGDQSTLNTEHYSLTIGDAACSRRGWDNQHPGRASDLPRPGRPAEVQGDAGRPQGQPATRPGTVQVDWSHLGEYFLLVFSTLIATFLIDRELQSVAGASNFMP